MKELRKMCVGILAMGFVTTASAQGPQVTPNTYVHTEFAFDAAAHPVDDVLLTAIENQYQRKPGEPLIDYFGTPDEFKAANQWHAQTLKLAKEAAVNWIQTWPPKPRPLSSVYGLHFAYVFNKAPLWSYPTIADVNVAALRNIMYANGRRETFYQLGDFEPIDAAGNFERLDALIVLVKVTRKPPDPQSLPGATQPQHPVGQPGPVRPY